jgi:hypothetical protein
MAMGLMLSYVLYRVGHVPGRTLKAILFDRISGDGGREGWKILFARNVRIKGRISPGSDQQEQRLLRLRETEDGPRNRSTEFYPLADRRVSGRMKTASCPLLLLGFLKGW